MSLIPVLINVGSIWTPVLCTALSSSLAAVHLSFESGASEFAQVDECGDHQRAEKGQKRSLRFC